MADIQAGNYVTGRSNGRVVEGYVLRLVSVHGPRNTLILRGGAYILNTDHSDKIVISSATDLSPASPDLDRIRDLTKLGFEKTAMGWSHPQHPFPEASLVKIPPGQEPELPDMEGILSAIRSLSLTPKAAR